MLAAVALIFALIGTLVLAIIGGRCLGSLSIAALPGSATKYTWKLTDILAMCCEVPLLCKIMVHYMCDMYTSWCIFPQTVYCGVHCWCEAARGDMSTLSKH